MGLTGLIIQGVVASDKALIQKRKVKFNPTKRNSSYYFLWKHGNKFYGIGASYMAPSQFGWRLKCIKVRCHKKIPMETTLFSVVCFGMQWISGAAKAGVFPTKQNQTSTNNCTQRKETGCMFKHGNKQLVVLQWEGMHYWHANQQGIQPGNVGKPNLEAARNPQEFSGEKKLEQMRRLRLQRGWWN